MNEEEENIIPTNDNESNDQRAEKAHFYENENADDSNDTITKVTGMYKDWFLDYASYVILERAVPAIEDGFKPVQRRIMHSLKELDDGRYNKVANVVGHTMQYHPHGDASIGDAMVQIGQKELLIDCQETGAISLQETAQQLRVTSKRDCRSLHWRLFTVRKLLIGAFLMTDVGLNRIIFR
ncbi:DNA gyrase subunit A [Flavobacterium sp. 3HN19-14]|uniref:DNA gyrase subunit A n=1 Tax=Flavobacterium sp. 3HN19-14 TaxID=3448133 RepID=UPI003EE18295